jgi:hypothetical protein
MISKIQAELETAQGVQNYYIDHGPIPEGWKSQASPTFDV